ncbi:hypothetical protein MKX03_014254 [Papaver bracteatum]|nr:hypothetical protein MKX03_014254 [Papaver bracteatum]
MNVFSNVKAFSDISCDEFSTQIIIGEFGKDGKLRDGSSLIEFATEEAANKAIKFQRLDLLGYTGLSYFFDKSDVIKFFKEAGEIVDVHLSYNGDRKFSGSGHIEFVTEEAAKKTGRLNGVELLGSCVKLYHKAKGTGASITLCLKNDIADVRFSYDEYGTFGRFAHVEFATGEAAKQAVRWNGRDLKGCPVELGIVREPLCIRIFLIKHFRTCKSIVQVDIPRESHYWCSHRALDLDGQEVDATSLTVKDHVPVCFDVGGTGARQISDHSCFRGYDGASLGKAGSYCYPPHYI